MNYNPLLLTDSYKVTHWKQYPPDVSHVYSYLESRGSDNLPEIEFFGLLPKLFQLQRAITKADLFHADCVWRSHFGSGDLFNAAGWKALQQLGYLPLSIRALPEGTIAKPHDVLMTIENTDERFPWLTNWVETQLMQVWYPITVGTLSRAIKKVILNALYDTGDPGGIDFKLHDFGFRGVSSIESAALGGAAHLVNFKGTDTAVALQLIAEIYGLPIGAEIAGFSIPAAEHSTITSWGPGGELDAYTNMLDQFPSGLVAVVSDSYDICRACRDLWGGQLRDRVLARNGTLIIRPDSGDPATIVVAILAILGQAFGFTVNAKGFKVLPPQVRIIQGDGVDLKSIQKVLWNMRDHEWSADNIAFGMGGALLQKLNRDTLKMAIKCSAVKRNGRWVDVWKDPVTDPGKMSKRGRVGDHLPEVFRDGVIKSFPRFSDIRSRAAVV